MNPIGLAAKIALPESTPLQSAQQMLQLAFPAQRARIQPVLERHLATKAAILDITRLRSVLRLHPLVSCATQENILSLTLQFVPIVLQENTHLQADFHCVLYAQPENSRTPEPVSARRVHLEHTRSQVVPYVAHVLRQTSLFTEERIASVVLQATTIREQHACNVHLESFPLLARRFVRIAPLARTLSPLVQLHAYLVRLALFQQQPLQQHARHACSVASPHHRDLPYAPHVLLANLQTLQALPYAKRVLMESTLQLPE